MPAAKRLTLRLPLQLHQLLLEQAASDRRSLNRQIEFLLWQALRVDADAFAATRTALQPTPPAATPPLRPLGASRRPRSGS